MGLLKYLESTILEAISTKRYLPMQIDITNACNLKCVHCYHPHHKNENPLSFEQWTRIIDDYFALTARLKYRPMIILCGGEPTLSPNFDKILKYIGHKDLSTYIMVLTNGTRLSENILASVLPFKNLSFQISLDGPDATRHDLIRGRGSFDKTLQGVELLKQKKIQFHFLCVLSKRSSEWIEDFFKMSQVVKPQSMNFTRLVENGFALDLKADGVDRMLRPLELKAAYIEIIKQSATYGVGTRTNGPLFSLVFPGLGRSGRYWESLVIDYQGNLLATSRSRSKIGNLLEQSLEDLFLNSPIMNRLRKGDIKVCGDCKFLNVCGGDRNAAYATYGDFFGPDPGCWLITENQRRIYEN